MAGYPVANTDIVLYEKKDIYADKDIMLSMLDGSQCNLWGNVLYNGLPLGVTLPPASNAETIAGTLNTKSVTPAGLTARLVVIDVRSYGAVCDNATICTTQIQAAADAASALAAVSVDAQVQLWFPPDGPGYRTDAEIRVGVRVQVWMDSPIWCTSSGAHPILTVGMSTSSTFGRHRYQVRRTTNSTWADENQIGLKLVNFLRADISIQMASFNTVGVKLVGDSRGWVYNTVRLAYIGDNKIAVLLDAINSGWVNENLYLGGNITCSSSTSAARSRYGVVVRSSDGTYPGNNNNVFIKPSIEIAGVVFTGGAEAVAFDFESGGFNRIISARVESPQMQTVARFAGSSQQNKVEVALSSYVVGGPTVIDTSLYRSNVFEAQIEQHTRRGYLIYESPNLAKAVTSWAGTPALVSYHIPNVEFFGNASTTSPVHDRFALATRFAPRDDYVEIMSVGAMSVTIDTSQAKRFRLDLGLAGDGGRIAFQPYDVNGVVIDGAALAATPSVSRLEPYGNLTWNTTNGGRWVEGNDRKAPGHQQSFWVTDDVKSVAILLNNGTATMKLKSINIYCLDMPAVNVWSANDNVGRVSTIQPSYGYFNVNEFVRKDGFNSGWLCTTAGVACDAAWVASTAYALNAVVYNGTNVYRVTVAGTSAASGGPTGTSPAIVDNTVTWKYIGAKAVFTT